MCIRVYENKRYLGIISVKIPINWNIVFLDDIFFYTQTVPKKSITAFDDKDVGVVVEQIIIAEFDLTVPLSLPEQDV